MSFAAEFEQHRDGKVPALFGSIFFSANAPVSPELDLTLTGCLHCHPGDHLIAQVTLRNPGSTPTTVELKVGVRLPNGTSASLLGVSRQHLVVTLPAGLDATFPALNATWPAGLAEGVWRVEGVLLDPVMGKTFSRDVKVFELEP